MSDKFLLPTHLQRPFKGVLFDLDGTLIDTEQLHYDAFKQATEELGYEFDRFAQEVMYQGSFRKLFEAVADIQNISSDLRSKIYERKVELTLYYADSQVETVEGVMSFLELLRDRNVPMGVVTNSDRLYAEKALVAHGLMDYFSHLVTSTDVATFKPDPEGYIKGAELLALEPQEVVVFENTDAGIEAAVAAEMSVIAVRSLDLSGQSTYEAAHHAIDTFADDSINELMFHIN